MLSHLPDRPAAPLEVSLRAVEIADVPTLFSYECDPAWCATAKVKPRPWDVFEAVWTKIIRERANAANSPRVAIAGPSPADEAIPAAPALVQRAILVDGTLCGSIGLHLHDGRPALGYGLGPAFWGRGIASRAVSLLLAEGGPMAQRPLHAQCAASNLASIRILLKHGFAVVERRTAPETDRTLAREEVRFILA